MLINFSFNVFSDKNIDVFYSSIQIVKNESFLNNQNFKRKFNTLNNKYKFFNVSTIKSNFGVGTSSVNSICKKFGLNKKIKIFKFKLKTITKITKFINKLTFKKTLKLKVINIRKFAMNNLKHYKGSRYALSYPIRGQRTHTNSKTRKKLKNKNQGYFT